MYINFLIKMKNAEAIGKRGMKIRFSRMDKAIADILVRQGFLNRAEVKGRPSKRFIYAEFTGARELEGVRFLSKPSVRRYIGRDEVKKVKGGHGLLVLSTSKGIMTGADAWREKIGGQALFEIW